MVQWQVRPLPGLSLNKTHKTMKNMYKITIYYPGRKAVISKNYCPMRALKKLVHLRRIDRARCSRSNMPGLLIFVTEKSIFCLDTACKEPA